MKIVIATDSFKGCLTSSEVASIAEQALRSRWARADILKMPVSDGGEGFLEAFESIAALKKISVKRLTCNTFDPLMRPVTAEYLLFDDGTAVVEVAKVVGINLLREGEYNPMKATSHGVGILINEIVRRGCRRIITGLGGTVTSDAGMGMADALDINGLELPEVIVATDVENPLCGANGAAYVFARQKGATDEMLPLLDQRAREFASHNAKVMKRDCSRNAGAGAAGGLGYAFMQFLGARRVSGAGFLLDETDFNSMIIDAGLVITGEGHADRQTLMGKLPFEVLRRCRQHLPMKSECILMAGTVSDRKDLLDAGFSKVIQITPDDMPIEKAVMKSIAKRNIEQAICNVIGIS